MIWGSQQPAKSRCIEGIAAKAIYVKRDRLVAACLKPQNFWRQFLKQVWSEQIIEKYAAISIRPKFWIRLRH